MFYACEYKFYFKRDRTVRDFMNPPFQFSPSNIYIPQYSTHALSMYASFYISLPNILYYYRKINVPMETIVIHSFVTKIRRKLMSADILL